MSNEYFQPGSVPAPNAPGSSAIIRGEFTSVAAAFDKLPVMAGNAGELVAINGTGTGLLASGILISTLVTTAGAQTLTNKTLAWGDNTYPGFGTAATKNAGTGVGDVPTLSAEATLPTLNGSNLTNLNINQSGTIVGIAYGGTGENTLSGAQGALGIDLKADANNAVLTGAPVAPTPPVGDNSARIATTYFVTETVVAIGAFAPSNAAPLMNGVAASGVGILGARDDHVHPTDTSRAPIASPVFTGDPKAPTPTPGDNDTSIATTAFVNAEIAADRPYSVTNPLINGAAAQGVSANISRQDHVHPTDTSRAPIASPVFTGDPKAPTPLTSDNDTSIATTAFVQSLLAQQPAAGMQPSNATPLINGVATPGTGVDGSRYDHVHPTDTSRAPIASPVFTGNPTAPTPSPGDNDTSIATTAFVNAEIAADRPYSDTNPLINGAAAQGVSANISRQDHVHPTDTSRAPIASPVFTGDPKAPTPSPGDNDTSIATTAFVNAEIAADRPYSDTNPLINGVAAQGASARVSRQDHVHPIDTSRAALASPTFTGVPAAPTAPAGTNTTQLATTAFVITRTPNASETAVGLIELATNAEVAAGTDALRAVTPAGLDSVFLNSLSESGYQKLPGGLIIQWGKTSALAFTVVTTVSYPIAFPNAVLMGNVESETPASATSGNTYFSYLSLSQFTTANPDSGAARVYRWMAIGY